MALRVYLSQNENNEKVGTLGRWYLRVDNLPPIGIDEVADLIKEHNIGQSKGTIVGILKDFVSIIRQQVLMGQPVKIDDLAIFKASVQNRGGWAELKDVSLHIGGDKDNVQAVKMVAQATGDFTKSELSKDGKLVLDRQSAQLVKAAGGTVDGGDDDTDPDGSSDGDDGGSTPVTPVTPSDSSDSSSSDDDDGNE